MESLEKAINSIVQLNAEELRNLSSLFKSQEYKEGDLLFNEGEVIDYLYFIEKGVVVYSSEVNSEMSVIEFYSDGEFHSDMYSYLTTKPATCTALVQEDSIIMSASKSELISVFDQTISLQRFGRGLSEHILLNVLRRNYEKQIFNNKERYLRFIDKRYDLSQRVPQYKIASYLNITSVGLSKIRKRIQSKRG